MSPLLAPSTGNYRVTTASREQSTPSCEPPGLSNSAGCKTHRFPRVSLPVNQQTGEFRNDDNSEGPVSPARQKGAPGAISVATSFPPRPVQKPARQRVGGARSPPRPPPPFPPRRLLPDLSPSPGRLSKLQAQPRVSADPGGWGQESSSFSQGSAMRPSGRPGRAGLGGPQRPTLPRAQGLRAGSPGPGEPRGATPPPGLFVLPRGPAAAPTSSLPAERRRLAQGFPAARPRPIGAARAVLGVATRTPPPPAHASHARPPRRARARPPRRGVARASVRGLGQVAAWTLRPGPLEGAP